MENISVLIIKIQQILLLFTECNSAFNVQLNVELNQYGCTDSVIREVAVYCNPEANFEYGNACSGEKKFNLMIYLLLEIHQYNLGYGQIKLMEL